MSTSPESRPYAALAALIIAGRRARGLTQAALAGELGFKQQAVSRWEKGTHRPSVAQIPALAALIDEPVATLMERAGYARPASASLSALFPVDALDPATFEQFIADVVEALEPGVEAKVQGGRGHQQDGTDIIVTFPDGRRWSLQCKRVERFGTADALQAIARHKIEADRAFLVLSKIASPPLIEAVESQANWTLWDKQSLTRRIRTLPLETQERLVDIYFRGQRMALLGRGEPGPWLLPHDYFAPFAGRGAVFSHDWDLVGRQAEIAALVGALGDEATQVALLVGPGGIGKTRLLKEAVERFGKRHKKAMVRFLSTACDADAASLEALGPGRKILVVDDAHDREGLGLIIEYALQERNRATLLIATRPYAEQRIRNDLGLYRLTEPTTIKLERMDRKALDRLIVAILKEFDGHPEWAASIRAASGDSPLVAAMAARVVAREGLVAELAQGQHDFRQIILSRFTNVITGDLGTPADAGLIRALLEVLALIQPFHIADRRLAELAQIRFPDATANDVSRVLKLLVDGGILYKRGSLYRLMPDLLGDFLIEQTCIGADERLTDFPIALAKALDSDRLTHLLVNLGRMDWRRRDGDPTDSDLLQPIWKQLESIDRDYDSRLEAVQAVAYYQPRQALDFVQAQIEQGRLLKRFSPILRRVAFSTEHRHDALRLLWELGQHDEREVGPNPEHPIRAFAELVEYDRHKPLDFIEEVAEFAFALLNEPGAWAGVYTPLDLLAPLLKGEGMTTASTGRAISLSPFFVDYSRVRHLRQRLIARVITLLRHEDPKVAGRAASFIAETIRPPHGMMASAPSLKLLRHYTREFSGTIGQLAELIATGTLAPTTLIALIKSLSWHAEYDEGKLGDQVRAIFLNLPADLDFRLHAALNDAAGYSFVGQAPFDEWDEDGGWLAAFADELGSAYLKPRVLCQALLAARARLNTAGMSSGGDGALVTQLVERDSAFGEEIIDRGIADPASPLRNYLGIALGAALERDPAAARPRIARLLASPEPALRQGAARALIGLRRPIAADDRALLGTALGDKDPNVAALGLLALRTWRELGPRDVIALALSVRFETNTALFDTLAAVLCRPRRDLRDASRSVRFLDSMNLRDVTKLFKQMRNLPRLEGHWVTELLSGVAKRHGTAVAQLLFDRADHALGLEDSSDYEAISYALRRGHLGLHELASVRDLLWLAWLWLRGHDESGAARYQVSDVFAAMFRLESPAVVDFLDAMLDQATIGDLKWIGHLLRQIHHNFVFTYRAFVLRYIERCKSLDVALVKEAIDQIGAAANSGSWSGAVGEPTKRDLETERQAKEVLSTLSRLSPAYPLYRDIHDHARRNIARSLAEGEAMDDEDE